MYKWTGKGVLRHGKLVVYSGETIPDVVSSETIKSLVKKGTAKKMTKPTSMKPPKKSGKGGV